MKDFANVIRLAPPEPSEHISVARLSSFWYIACRSDELRSAPLKRQVLGLPLVLFREESGQLGALEDRCPHRNVPLSLGHVVDGGLQCLYHGWTFSAQGACIAIPGLCQTNPSKRCNAVSYPVREQDGYVWIYPEPGAEPASEPYRFPRLDESRYTSVRGELAVNATLHATLENILDVPHTSFLHGGLFRNSRQRNEIQAIVRRTARSAEAEFIGEPRPTGLAARILSPSGGLVTHFDRFFLPSVAQVEYRLGDENHLLITQSLTPETDFRTTIYSVLSFRLRLPGWLVRPILRPVAWRILRQDARVLEQQSENIRSFRGERFVSTEIDLLGPHIWHLLKKAERQEPSSDGELVEKQIRMTV